MRLNSPVLYCKIIGTSHTRIRSGQTAGGVMKHYRSGYIMGVFDLFHIGHLNLLRNAKEHCDFLRVGILSDELVREQKKHDPVIPLEERMAIVAAVRYVDDVVVVDDGLLSKVAEWYRHPFECFFSGDDYEGNPLWEKEKIELSGLGSTIEFFPYTATTSSTKIRALIDRQLAARTEDEQDQAEE